MPDVETPKAVIFGCEGPVLTDWEKGFFADTNPLGLILFARNCQSPDQVRTLVADFRRTVGREDGPVLIDQEGGRVARLRPPHWRAAPAAAELGALGARDGTRARRAVTLNARLLAAELADLGITVDCAPVLDLSVAGAHDVIGDRAFGSDPEVVACLGRAVCEGLLAGGVLPVIKHMPGHGRVLVDSHHALPRVEASRADLERTDFRPFAALSDAPWGMTAHVVYTALDPDNPATTSARIITEVIRGTFGFDGVLVSDDLSMNALSGGLGARAAAALAAGCDVALHCNGRAEEMIEVAAVAPVLSPDAVRRLAAASAQVTPPASMDTAALTADLDDLLAVR